MHDGRHVCYADMMVDCTKKISTTQLLGAPLSIQHTMELSCSLVKLPPCGISLVITALRISFLALNICW